MRRFEYHLAESAESAVRLAAQPCTQYLGGGTNLVDLMREGIESPGALVDVSRLPGSVADDSNGNLRVDGSVHNTALAEHVRIRRDYPLVARAVLAGASGQIRNMATVAGNLLQRTRCPYFYDLAGTRCNKRELGSGCDAREGFTRDLAVLGGSVSCVAVHPSDLCVALVAADATVQLLGPNGRRDVLLEDFYTLPGDRPDIENVLEHSELITSVTLPGTTGLRRSGYRKVRDRASYAFALASVAAAIRLDGGGLVEDVHVAFGGVATKPWRARLLEAALRGEPPGRERFLDAVREETSHAHSLPGNAFKVELIERTVVDMLSDLCGPDGDQSSTSVRDPRT